MSFIEQLVVFLGVATKVTAIGFAFFLLRLELENVKGTHVFSCLCENSIKALADLLIGFRNSSVWSYNCANGLAGEQRKLKFKVI